MVGIVQTNVVSNVPFKLKVWKHAGLIYNHGEQPVINMDGCEIFVAQSKILFPKQQLMLHQ